MMKYKKEYITLLCVMSASHTLKSYSIGINEDRCLCLCFGHPPKHYLILMWVDR